MPRNQTYQVLIRWTHRRYGPQWEKVTAEGTSIRRGIAHALLNFFSSSSKAQHAERLDAHKALQVEARRVRTPAAR
jgi:hypothetical protein